MSAYSYLKMGGSGGWAYTLRNTMIAIACDHAHTSSKDENKRDSGFMFL